MDKEKIVAVYVRVSTGRQIEKCSLPFQRKEIKNYCKHVLHLDNVVIFEDAGRSAKDTNRPAYERMMQQVVNGEVSHVVVYKIDRISRNLVDFSLMYDTFQKHRVTFVSLNEQFDTSTAIGEAILKIMLVFAELERKQTSERVTDIMLDRAADGKWNGSHVPFGYRWNDEIKYPEPDPNESKILKMIYDKYEGGMSTTHVCRYLNNNSIPTKRGGSWTAKTVADILRNPFYKGTYRYNYRESPHGKIKPESEWIIIEDNHDGLISKEQWKLCNDRMDKNIEARNKPGAPHKQKYTHVFGGRLTCVYCGSSMISNKDKARDNGFRPSMYHCGSRYKDDSCKPRSGSDVYLGPFVFNYIANIVKASKMKNIKNTLELEKVLLSGNEFKNIVGIEETGLNETFDLMNYRGASVLYKQIAVKPDSSEQSDIANLKSEAQKLERASERLKKAYLFDDDSMSEKEYLTIKRDLELKLIDIKNKIADSEQNTFTTKNEYAFMNSASTFLITHKLLNEDHINYSDFAASIDDDVLQKFVASIIDNIKLKDGQVDTIVFKSGLTHHFLYN